MQTLQEFRTNFNSKLHISHSGGKLSSDAGLVLIKELMVKLKFSQLVRQLVHFNENRHYYKYSNHQLLEQLILQLVAGYNTDLAAQILRSDPIFKLLNNLPQLASQSSLSRFWQRCDDKTITSLQTLNQALLDKYRMGTNQTQLIIDVDSTHFDTYGHQENTNFNAHYKTMGYHPLVAFDGQNGNFLKAILRPGNVYTSSEVKAFITPLLKHYQQTLPNTDILVRGDSGFATPELYDTCEANSTYYLIRLKSNRNLSKIAERYITVNNQQDWSKTETYYYSTTYQAKAWIKPRHIYIKSTRLAGELLFKHEFLVTNFVLLNAKDAFKAYHQRGKTENYIKEAKIGLFLDKTDSSSFEANQARMMLSVLAYNLINFLRQLLPADKAGLSTDTLRLWIFKIAGKVVYTSRQIHLKLSTYHVHKKLFYQIFVRIQAIEW